MSIEALARAILALEFALGVGLAAAGVVWVVEYYFHRFKGDQE